MIKNYIFDLGNVVLILRWDKVLDNYKISSVERELLMNNIFKSVEWEKLDEGTITKDEGIKIMKSNLPENLHKYCDDIMERWTEGLDVNNEMIDFIKDIKSKGYNTYVLSNAPLEIKDFLERKELNKLFDGIILSAYEKMLKPNKEIYELALKRFNLNSEESIFIDDKFENVTAAKNSGIDSFQFDYKNMAALKNYIDLL